MKTALPTSWVLAMLTSYQATAQSVVETAQDRPEPAGFFLLVLGLLALLLGMRNLRDLRSKRMMPPRPEPPKPHAEQQPDVHPAPPRAQRKASAGKLPD